MDARGGTSFSMKYFSVEFQGKALGGGCTGGGGEFFDEIFLLRISREGSQRWMHGGESFSMKYFCVEFQGKALV